MGYGHGPYEDDLAPYRGKMLYRKSGSSHMARSFSGGIPEAEREDMVEMSIAFQGCEAMANLA